MYCYIYCTYQNKNKAIVKKFTHIIILILFPILGYTQGGGNYEGCTVDRIIESYDGVGYSYFFVRGKTTRIFNFSYYTTTEGDNYGDSAYINVDNGSNNVVNPSYCQVYANYKYSVFYNLGPLGQYLVDSDSVLDSYSFGYNCCSSI